MTTRVAPVTRLLTIPEAAGRLRCSDDHVYRLIAGGQLPATDIRGPGARRPKTRVAEAALADYISTNTRTAR